MKIKYLVWFPGFWMAVFWLPSCSRQVPATDSSKVFFQASTINALLAGVYDGDLTFAELERHGNFGLGTVNGLDGEMIGLDGKFYQIKTDGKAYLIPDSVKTPFAETVFFRPDTVFRTGRPLENLDSLENFLKKLLPSKNIFYAFRIEGSFPYMKTRSVPRQEKPYPPLVDVVKQQAIFEFRQVRGTLVGFWCPGFVKGINVPGFHFHFITADRKAGGHVLDCRLNRAKVKMALLSVFQMALPRTQTFYHVSLSRSRQTELNKVEK